MADYSIQWDSEIQNGPSYLVYRKHLIDNYEALNSAILDRPKKTGATAQTIAPSYTFDTTSTVTFNGPLPNFKGYLRIGRPLYVSASTFSVPFVRCDNSGTSQFIIKNTTTTLDITTSGAGGLDTGAEASNTWYYLYAIGKTDGTASLILSVTNEAVTGSITLPSGYTLKRQLPFQVRNDGSSNFLPFYVGAGWPNIPYIGYTLNTTDVASPPGTLNVLNAGTQTSYTDVTLSSFVPPTSKLVRLQGFNLYSATNRTAFIRPNGSSINGYAIRATSSVLIGYGTFDIETDASQLVEYKMEGAGANLTLDVLGYYVTEILS